MGPAHRSRFRSRAAVIVTLAALPILWTPDVVVVRKVVGGFRVAIPGALLFAADGWIATGYVFVWQIALFLSLGESLFAPESPRLPLTVQSLAGSAVASRCRRGSTVVSPSANRAAAWG
jgi:hypothetical protein